VIDLALLGVGPQRTGTTWLWECLRRHPDLCFPHGIKETQFFDARYREGWAWYSSHFAHQRPGQRAAEIGATYFDAVEVPLRVAAHAPRARIVVTLRDPVARTYSLFLHHVKKGRMAGDFARAVEEHPRLVDGSRYGLHLERWRKILGSARVRVVLLDDIESDPVRTLADIQQFAEIRAVPAPAAAFEQINRASLPAHRGLARVAARAAARLHAAGLHGPVVLARRLGLHRVYGGRRVPPLTPELRRQLIAEFEPDIAYVEALLGRPLPAWRRAA
jgi:hypothetical protein